VSLKKNCRYVAVLTYRERGTHLYPSLATSALAVEVALEILSGVVKKKKRSKAFVQRTVKGSKSNVVTPWISSLQKHYVTINHNREHRKLLHITPQSSLDI